MTVGAPCDSAKGSVNLTRSIGMHPSGQSMERPHMQSAMRGVRSAVIIESILTPRNTHAPAVEFPYDESREATAENFLSEFNRNKPIYYSLFIIRHSSWNSWSR